MTLFHSFWTILSASELPGLLALLTVTLAQRGADFARARRLVYSPAILLPALPATMAASAVAFSHDRELVAVNSSAADRLSWLPFCLYFVQFPVGFLIPRLLTFRTTTKRELIIWIVLVSLLMIQMALSFPVMLLASMEITGDYL